MKTDSDSKGISVHGCFSFEYGDTMSGDLRRMDAIVVLLALLSCISGSFGRSLTGSDSHVADGIAGK